MRIPPPPAAGSEEGSRAENEIEEPSVSGRSVSEQIEDFPPNPNTESVPSEPDLRSVSPIAKASASSITLTETPIVSSITLVDESSSTKAIADATEESAAPDHVNSETAIPSTEITAKEADLTLPPPEPSLSSISSIGESTRRDQEVSQEKQKTPAPVVNPTPAPETPAPVVSPTPAPEQQPASSVSSTVRPRPKLKFRKAAVDEQPISEGRRGRRRAVNPNLAWLHEGDGYVTLKSLLKGMIAEKMLDRYVEFEEARAVECPMGVSLKVAYRQRRV